jgi:hypothetical protein
MERPYNREEKHNLLEDNNSTIPSGSLQGKFMKPKYYFAQLDWVSSERNMRDTKRGNS